MMIVIIIHFSYLDFEYQIVSFATSPQCQLQSEDILCPEIIIFSAK